MKLPINCPSCQKKLKVRTLHCMHCQTKVEGEFNLPLLAVLPDESQQFIVEFIKNSGSLKEMSKALSLSYPTVRNRLDEIINNLKMIENEK